MLPEMRRWRGKVLTVTGPVEPQTLGRVLMHEHLHSDPYDWQQNRFVDEERPATPERLNYLLREAVPLLRACREHGCFAFVETTPAPWRAWPDVYAAVSQAADVRFVLCTGFYREVEVGTYWVKRPEDRIWSAVVTESAEELAQRCIREIVEGVHGSGVRAGAIKLGTSGPEMTELEKKTFRAGAIAQQATGAHVTTHCTKIGAETTQLRALEADGADIRRAVIGHTAWHLMDPGGRKVCLEWMRRGANFLPTNLGIDPRDAGRRWQPLVEAIHEVFDAGLGDRLVLGLDSGYCSESGPLAPMTFLPPPPFLHMFTHTLPALRELGLTGQQEQAMMQDNPQRIIPIQ